MAWEEISQGMHTMATGLRLWRDLRQAFGSSDSGQSGRCKTDGCRNDAAYCAICYEAAGRVRISNVNIVRGGLQ